MAFDWIKRKSFRGKKGQDMFQGDGVEKNRYEMCHESFDVPFGTLEDTSHDVFQRMDDMLSWMFSSSLTFGAENSSDGPVKNYDPRTLMLKNPDSFVFDVSHGNTQFETKEPTCLIDSDIDDQVAKHGSLWMASPGNNVERHFSYKTFSFIRSIRLPDGSMEEHHSVTDNDGNVTTVRRTIGEQSHEVTTHSDARGLIEKQEIFTNLDESDLSEFQKRLQNAKQTEQVPAIDMYLNPSIERPTPHIGEPSYFTLFKQFFGR